MRQQGLAFYRDLNAMVKGEAPYDAAKVEAAMVTLAETAPKIPAAFPESIKGKSSAEARFLSSPKVWDNRAEFEADAAKLTKAVQDNRSKVGSLDALKAAYPAINAACNGCHETFRLRKS